MPCCELLSCFIQLHRVTDRNCRAVHPAPCSRYSSLVTTTRRSFSRSAAMRAPPSQLYVTGLYHGRQLRIQQHVEGTHSVGLRTLTNISDGTSCLNSVSSLSTNPVNSAFPPITTMFAKNPGHSPGGKLLRLCTIASASPAWPMPRSDGLNSNSGTTKRSFPRGKKSSVGALPAAAAPWRAAAAVACGSCGRTYPREVVW